MGIQKDAGELLGTIYSMYLEQKNVDFWYSIDAEKLVDSIGWELDRIKRALTYLYDLKFIKLYEDSTIISGLYPAGIDTIENKDKFERQFGFTLNLGLLQFNWNAKEKK